VARGLLVHEWLSRTGGSENVFEVLMGMFPEADVLALWNDAPERFTGRRVDETWLARTPLRRHKVAAAPLMPVAWRSRRGGGPYDWALISTHLFAHHVRFRESRAGARTFAYVHSPARYLWDPEVDGRGDHPLARAAAVPLRVLDRRRAQRHHAVAANSAYVARRIERAWGLPAVVIHPPVDVARVQNTASWADTLSGSDAAVFERLPDGYLLGASRFVPYKRLDRVIDAGEAAGLPVVLAGSGPDEARLRARAADAMIPVTFVDRPSDRLLFSLYEGALAYVFPAEEDFGIMPVEALAAGSPVVGYARGGVPEIVTAETGALVSDWSSLTEVRGQVERAIAVDRAACRARAERFSTERFMSEIRGWLASHDVPTGTER
jgi:glycosyltransferase involved in cell wall biosynthesis